MCHMAGGRMWGPWMEQGEEVIAALCPSSSGDFNNIRGIFRTWPAKPKSVWFILDLHPWKKRKISKISSEAHILTYPMLANQLLHCGRTKEVLALFMFNKLAFSLKVFKKKKSHSVALFSSPVKTTSSWILVLQLIEQLLGSSVVEWINKMTPKYTNG